MKSDSRYLGALIIAPFIIFLFLGGIYLKGLTLVLSLIGMHEFYKALSNKNIKAFSIIGYLGCLVYYLTNFRLDILVMLVVFIVFISLIIPVIDLKYNFIDSAVTVLGFVYVTVFFSFIPMVNYKPYGKYTLWLIFIASWLCDTTAYYVGRAFGKTKLCPEVSPKKTVEGSIGGLLGSAIACGIFGIIVSKYVPEIAIYHYFIIGAICGVFCQFGDLVASSVKRYVGIKDYSHLIPGHGGILDRFDSILFAAVIVYSYLTFIIAI